MNDQDFLNRFSNKQIELSFDGIQCSFHLSQGLFSSFNIDAGTRLLLKTVAKHIDLDNVASALDVGCGIGVIGICIAKRNPLAQCVLQDRDALAVRISNINCALNGVSSNVRVTGGLAFYDLPKGEYDLILSNLPAKAGNPVLKAMIHAALGRIGPGGRVGVVVVMTLAEFLGNAIIDSGGRIVYQEESREHCVYHFTGPSAPPNLQADLEPYIRRNGSFAHKNRSYRIKTVFNLPSFDTLGRELELAYGLVDRFLSKPGVFREILVWNPGHGHILKYLEALWGGLGAMVHLASRDALQLAIASDNLAVQEAGNSYTTYHVPDMISLAEVMKVRGPSLVIMFPDLISGVRWQDDIAKLAAHNLEKGGYLLVSSTSTEIQRLLYVLKGMAVLGNKKDRGSRAILCKATSTL